MAYSIVLFKMPFNKLRDFNELLSECMEVTGMQPHVCIHTNVYTYDTHAAEVKVLIN